MWNDPKTYEEPEEVREAIGRAATEALARADANARFEEEQNDFWLEHTGVPNPAKQLGFEINHFREEFSHNPDYIAAFYEQPENRIDLFQSISYAGVGSGVKAITRNLGKIFPRSLTSVGFRRLIGYYRKGGAKETHPRGHHPFMQSAFKGHPQYNPDQAFSISPQLIKEMGWSHQAMTNMQRYTL
jgi:hypothetical protein